MKPNLTWEEFLKAYELLVTDKQPEPGIHKIYNYLGKGSVSTITKFKKRLLEMRKNAVDTSSKALPDPISTAAIKLFNEMSAAIDEKEKALDEDVQKRYQEIDDTLKALKEKNQRADDTIEQLQAQLSTANDTIEKLKSEQHAQELKLSKAKSKNESLAAINAEQAKASIEIKSEYAKQLDLEKIHTEEAKKQRDRAMHEKETADHQYAQDILQSQQKNQVAVQTLKDEITKLNLFYAGELKEKESLLVVLQEHHRKTEESLAASLADNQKRELLHKKLQQSLDKEIKRADKMQDKVTIISQSLKLANETLKEIKIEKKELLSLLKAMQRKKHA